MIAAGVGALIGVYMAYQQVQNRIAEGEKKVAETMATWNEQAVQMIDEGATLNDIVDEFAGKINDASEAMEEGGVVADIFVNQKKIMGDSAQELNQILADSAQTYEEYVAAIEEYNATVEDSGAHLKTQAEAEKEAAEMRLRYAEYVEKGYMTEAEGFTGE